MQPQNEENPYELAWNNFQDIGEGTQNNPWNLFIKKYV